MLRGSNSTINLTELLAEYITPYSGWKLLKTGPTAYLIQIFSLFWGGNLFWPQATLRLRFEVSETNPTQMTLYTEFRHKWSFNTLFISWTVFCVLSLLVLGPPALLLTMMALLVLIREAFARNSRKNDGTRFVKRITAHKNISLQTLE